MGELMEAFPF